MAGQTYQVSYIIDVNATTAQTALNKFKQAVSSLAKSTKPITDLQRQVRGLMETMSALSRGAFTVNINVSPATKKIGKLVAALRMAKEEVRQLNAMGVTFGSVAKSSGKASSATVASTAAVRKAARTSTTARPTRSSTPAVFSTRPQNLGYRLFGPTPLPNNGGMAIDMLKGMGIAYGIAGIGTLISNVVNQAVQYDNTMKTVENILKSHDVSGNFNERFASMTTMIRDVGMQTKFKVTEVADAAKFLAMAGLAVDDISQAIRPIADIALVGDTDLGETADLVTNVMTAYNLEARQMRNAADIMTNTFTMSNTTLTEIAESYKYAASLLSAGKVSFEESTAAIGILGNAGIKGSQAGTTLRTIMANIVNPTKKQKAAWKEIGIDTYNSDGTRKSLIEIFQELNKADLDVSMFYRLFHKTAASGAVALATHIQEWQNIYLENFNAAGLTRKLAQEKQNTIQGLWAQLVSVFTDKGITAFGGIQGHIRSLISSFTEWLKTADAERKFKEISAAIMEFVNTIMTATKWFIKFFEWGWWFIKPWLKFQLMIWPIVKAFTALKSVFLGLMALKSIPAIIGAWTTSFFRLGSAATSAAVATTAASSAVATTAATTVATMPGHLTPFGYAGYRSLPPLTNAQYAKIMRGFPSWMGIMPNNQAVMYGANGKWNDGTLYGMPYYRHKKVNLSGVKYQAGSAFDRAVYSPRYNRQVKRMQIGNVIRPGLGNLGRMGVGTAAMGLGMAAMTQENANGWDAATGGLLSVAGIAAMTGGPIGWAVAAAAAVGALGTSLASWSSNLDALDAAIENFASTHQILDGAVVNSDNRTERYLEFVWRKNYDINDLITRRIELMKELMGIESPNATTTKDVGNTLFSERYAKYYAADSWANSSPAARRAAQEFNKQAQQFGIQIYEDAHGNWVYDYKGQIYKFNNPDGGSDTNDVTMYTIAAAMEMLYGPYSKKIKDENQLRLSNFLYGKATVQDVQNWANTFAAQYGPEAWKDLITPENENASTEEAKLWSGEDIAKRLPGAQLLWESLYPVINAQRAIIDFKNKLANNTLTEADVVNALRWGDYEILGQTLADYNPNDVFGWFNRLGYVGGDNPWMDPMGRETPENMAKMAIGQMEKLLKAINMLGPSASESTKDLQSYANLLISLAQAFLGQGKELEGAYDGQIKQYNGQNWKWDATTKTWNLIDNQGNLVQLTQTCVDLNKSLSNLSTTAATLDQNWPTLIPMYVGGADGNIGYMSESPFQWPVMGVGTTTTNTMLYNPLTAGQGGNFQFPSYFNGANSLYQAPTAVGTMPVTMNAAQFGAYTNGKGKKTKSILIVNDTDNSTDTSDDTSTDTSTDNNGNDGTHTADYKPSKSERAVPKQININIGNLMNVEAIDMTNPDHAAVVANLKSEIAYALYEAAADGTMMLNGLTNS